jgi:predicted transcriptional regulator
MATMTIRLPDNKHDRLKRLAEQRGVSLNKLIEEWSTRALAEFDAESRFRLLAAKGNPKRALQILDQLDEAFDSTSR